MKLDKKKIFSLATGGFGINSYNRFPAFIKNSEALNDAEYWYGLKEAYQMSDNLYKWKDLVRAAFSVKRPGKEYLMNKWECKRLDKLNKYVTIYRGMTTEERDSEDFGISWTLRKKRAEFFAFEYLRNHDTRQIEKGVKGLEVHKENIIAILIGRKEDEVVYLHKPVENPEEIIRKHIETYIITKDDPYEEIRQYLPGFDPSNVIVVNTETGEREKGSLLDRNSN